MCVMHSCKCKWVWPTVFISAFLERNQPRLVLQHPENKVEGRAEGPLIIIWSPSADRMTRKSAHMGETARSWTSPPKSQSRNQDPGIKSSTFYSERWDTAQLFPASDRREEVTVLHVHLPVSGTLRGAPKKKKRPHSETDSRLKQNTSHPRCKDFLSRSGSRKKTGTGSGIWSDGGWRIIRASLGKLWPRHSVFSVAPTFVRH